MDAESVIHRINGTVHIICRIWTTAAAYPQTLAILAFGHENRRALTPISEVRAVAEIKILVLDISREILSVVQIAVADADASIGRNDKLVAPRGATVIEIEFVIDNSLHFAHHAIFVNAFLSQPLEALNHEIGSIFIVSVGRGQMVVGYEHVEGDGQGVKARISCNTASRFRIVSSEMVMERL